MGNEASGLATEKITQSLLWRSTNGVPAPGRIIEVDDRLAADQAYKLVCEGTALLWRGDYHNAKQLLQALARRFDKRPSIKKKIASANLREAFYRHRQEQAQRSRLLGMLLLPLDADFSILLRRAPDVRAACAEVYGVVGAPFFASLRELLGIIGAHEWRRRGVPVGAIGDRIHPHYGVFSPVRGEYVDLVAEAPLPGHLAETAFDIGTGTGVLAILLAQRGVKRVVATDCDPVALACAEENVGRLGLRGRISLCETDLFPDGLASLIVCNPPWLPGKPHSNLERAIYDPENRMLKGFLGGVGVHLLPGGEAWLVISDLAEHLGLRSRSELMQWISLGGLRVLDRMDIRPRHEKSRDATDPLFLARSAEVTSLWRLGAME